MCANDGKGHRRQDGSDAEFTAGDVRINWSGCGGSRQLEIFREVIPISLGMPYVHVSNALHPDYSGYTPMCVYDWLHETTPEALARNRKGVANFVQMFTQANTAVGAHAERIGLKVEWQNPSTTISKLAWLTQTPKEFDFESSHWPPQFYHTGPFHDGAGRIDTDFPWEQLTGEPLIYGSLGTVMIGLPGVFRTIGAPLDTITQVAQSVRDGRVQYGLLPFETALGDSSARRPGCSSPRKIRAGM